MSPLALEQIRDLRANSFRQIIHQQRKQLEENNNLSLLLKLVIYDGGESWGFKTQTKDAQIHVTLDYLVCKFWYKTTYTRCACICIYWLMG